MAAPGTALAQAEHMTFESVAPPKNFPCLRRAKSLERHRQHFETIIKGSIEDVRLVLEALAGETIRDVGEGRDLAVEMLLTSLAHDLQRSVDRLMFTSMDKIWEQFDVNKDKFLQKEETRAMINSLLTTIEQNMGSLVADAMKPAADHLHDWIYSEKTGPMGMPRAGGMQVAIDMNIQTRINQASEKLTALLKTVIAGINNNSAEVADEVFNTLDSNKDGKLSKAEFVHGFAETFGQVLDFSKIAKVMLAESRRNPKSSLKRSETTSLDDIQGQLLSGLGLVSLVALVGAVIYYGMHHTRRPH